MTPANLLRRLWLHFAPPEAMLSEIQARHRLEDGYRLLPPAWEPCPKCRTLVYGAHDCPATAERMALVRFLVVRLSLQKDRREMRRRDRNRNVIQLPVRLSKAGAKIHR